MTTQHIIMTTEEAKRAEKAAIALRTYSNYVMSWVIVFQRLHGSEREGIDSFVHAVKQNTNYQGILSSTTISADVINPYTRGHLTLKTIQSLPIDAIQELAITGNLWLPVQSYYAIHGVGLATMMAIRTPVRDTHGSFRAAFSQILRAYMPKPFHACCTGGPKLGDYVFQNLDTTAEAVKGLIQLTDPATCDQIEIFIGKTLSTTRTEFLKERFISRRRSEKKRNLTMAAKLQCCDNEHPTSICDLLYRLRLNANYHNPDMYFYSDGGEAARERYRNLQYLTEVLISGLEALMEKAIGPERMRTLRESFQ